jgi:alpha(1,3/1,4) fucosyltransferase
MQITLDSTQSQFLNLQKIVEINDVKDSNDVKDVSESVMKIWFADFWDDFDPYVNFFTIMLRNNGVQFVVTPQNPDLLFCSCSIFGHEKLKYTCKKIYYTGENRRPITNDPDVVLNIGFDYTTDPNYFRLPLWYLYIDWYNDPDSFKIKNPQPVPLGWVRNPLDFPKSKFCSTVVGHGGCTVRNSIFGLVSNYKKVDSLGPWNNNVGFVIPKGEKNKLKHLLDYKFTICCENSSHPGYLTEKLLHAKVAGCIPIYWGDPEAHKDFNGDCFINVNKFNNAEELVRHIAGIDTGKIEDTYSKEPVLSEGDIENCFATMTRLSERIKSLCL